MKYILDFDDTLYNAAAFKARVAADGTEHLLFTPEIWRSYDVRDFLHTDTLEWLRSKNPEDVFILTSTATSDGAVFAAYQQAKLRSSQLGAWVREVVFVNGLKGVAAAEIASQFPPHEPIVFIDDKIEQCLSVQAALPQAIICLMVRDKATIGNTTTVQGMHVVHTLADVDAIIETICT